MKGFDKFVLILFSLLILVLSVFSCFVIFGWLDLGHIFAAINDGIHNQVIQYISIGVFAVLALFAIKCIFFTSDDEINGIKDGILLENSDGELVISKETLEELTENIIAGYEKIKDPEVQIEVERGKNVVVYISVTITDNAGIKTLSKQIQESVKATIKAASDLEVKEVNISVRGLNATNKAIKQEVKATEKQEKEEQEKKERIKREKERKVKEEQEKLEKIKREKAKAKKIREEQKRKAEQVKTASLENKKKKEVSKDGTKKEK